MFAILTLPDPLHPAVVHFPIVLILLGAIASLGAVFIRRWQLPAIVAALFILGAAGAVVAVQTGDRDGERAEKMAAIEPALEEHEEWAERTEIAAVVVSLLALGSALLTRWPVVARTLGIATALGAIISSWCVIQTGHHGGQLVYRHGAGVAITPAVPPGAHASAAHTAKPRRGHDDD